MFLFRLLRILMENTIRLDDLHINGLKIYQNTEDFCFGTDAVFLAWFASKKKFYNVCDLCCGNGIIPLLLSANTACRSINGVEISKEQADLAVKSIILNKLEHKINIINGDVRQIKNLLPSASFDLVTVNPPYSAGGSGFTAEGGKSFARAELCCTLHDIIFASAYLLKNGGRLCIVHKPERTADIFCTMRQNGIEPKILTLVIPKQGREPVFILIEGKKDAKPGMVIEKPIFIYENSENNEYTQQVKEIYKQQQNIDK